MIDWKRVAAPQDDQYDSQVALKMVTGRITPQHPMPYQRRPVGHAPTIFDGEVAVRYIAPVCPVRHLTHAPLRHPNIDKAVELVRRWPTAFRQFQLLMDSFHPMLDTTIPPSKWRTYRGSSSHSDEDKFGTMYGTITDPMGLAEAFVHEMAHNKLRALGVYFEDASHIIANPASQLFESPIRKDRMRPMTAVFHAQYSFIYVTALNVHVVAAEESPQSVRHYLAYLAYNVPRMEQGYEELTRHIRVDSNGKSFIEGFFEWSDEVLERANQLLRAHEVSKVPIARMFQPKEVNSL